MNAVERLRGLLEATALPWRAESRKSVEEARIRLPNGTLAAYLDGRVLLGESDRAALIVGAVNALPALLDVVEAAQRLRDSFPFLSGEPGQDFGGDWVPFVESLSRLNEHFPEGGK